MEQTTHESNQHQPYQPQQPSLVGAPTHPCCDTLLVIFTREKWIKIICSSKQRPNLLQIVTTSTAQSEGERLKVRIDWANVHYLRPRMAGVRPKSPFRVFRGVFFATFIPYIPSNVWYIYRHLRSLNCMHGKCR